jgi:hypothetical protein
MRYILLLIPLLAGCMFVPQTDVSLDPVTRNLRIKSPKDVVIKDFKSSLTPTATGTVVVIEFKSYESKNNIEVIRAITEANAEAARKGAELVGTLIDKAQ